MIGLQATAKSYFTLPCGTGFFRYVGVIIATSLHALACNRLPIGSSHCLVHYRVTCENGIANARVFGRLPHCTRGRRPPKCKRRMLCSVTVSRHTLPADRSPTTSIQGNMEVRPYNFRANGTEYRHCDLSLLHISHETADTARNCSIIIEERPSTESLGSRKSIGQLLQKGRIENCFSSAILFLHDKLVRRAERFLSASQPLSRAKSTVITCGAARPSTMVNNAGRRWKFDCWRIASLVLTPTVQM